jgi:hypothetical protein
VSLFRVADGKPPVEAFPHALSGKQPLLAVLPDQTQRKRKPLRARRKCVSRVVRTLFEANFRARRPEQKSFTSARLARVILAAGPSVNPANRRYRAVGPELAAQETILRGLSGFHNNIAGHEVSRAGASWQIATDAQTQTPNSKESSGNQLHERQ